MNMFCKCLLFFICGLVYYPIVCSTSDVGKGGQRRLIGRHVCARNKVIMTTVNDVQSYCKPSYQTYLRRCSYTSTQYCTGYRISYTLAYRPAPRLVAQTKTSYSCCPGWTQSRSSSDDCKKALCSKVCQNGGTCVKPDHCMCASGWTGSTCETDIDECYGQRHICERTCVNTKGSFRCTCPDGFRLQPDNRKCQRISEMVNTEGKKDFTREVDEVNRKIQRLEQHLSGVLNLNSRVESLTQMLQHHLKTFKNEKVPMGEKSTENNSTKKTTSSAESTEDRINSLSEQIAILEERLAECTCTGRETLEYPTPVR